MNSGRFLRSSKLASASSSGVVPALGAGCVVRGRALRHQEESAAAPLMMCQQFLQAPPDRLFAVVPSCNPKHQQASESGGVLLGGQRNRQRHASGHGAIEVDHPLQLVGHKEVRTVGMNGRRRIGVRVGRWIRPGVERQRDWAADGLQRLCAVR